MDVRPLPGRGFQKTVTITTHQRPPAVFTDPILGLEQARNGLALPLVEVAEESTDGFVVLVSVFGDTKEPTAQELADLHGTVAELRWHDRQASVR